jgi:hypothetical protein
MSFFGRSAQPSRPAPSPVAAALERLRNATAVADRRDIVQEVKVRGRSRRRAWRQTPARAARPSPPPA